MADENKKGITVKIDAALHAQVKEYNCDVSEGDIVVALDDCGENTLKRFGGYDPEEECFLLQYENEAVYPGRVIKVPAFEVQGVACHVIKSLKRR